MNGSVYGQPLLDDGQILVNTENNYSYGLNPVTGAILWSRHYGTPALASQLGCADLAPNMGITSTPVVDQATDIEYLVDNEYVSGSSGPQAYYMHALNLDAHGAEEPGFPVEIKGTATNDPQETFNATYEIQRPGLLLLGGVVYAGFAGHCDFPPYQGYIAGVSEAGKLTTLWSDETQSVVSGTTPQGGGIWQSGGGLVSDGPGTILITTGNGGLLWLHAKTAQSPETHRQWTWGSRWSGSTCSPTEVSNPSISLPLTTHRPSIPTTLISARGARLRSQTSISERPRHLTC